MADSKKPAAKAAGKQGKQSDTNKEKSAAKTSKTAADSAKASKAKATTAKSTAAKPTTKAKASASAAKASETVTKASKASGKKAAAATKTAKTGTEQASAPAPGSLAHQLLELHLQHELASFNDDQFLRDVHEEVKGLLAMLQQVSLRDWVTPEQIMGVIQRDVIDIKIAGGIAELAGDMANQVYLSDGHRDAKLREIMSAKQLEQFVEKILSLKSHRQRMVRRALDHPIYADLISHILYEGIVHYLANNNLLSGKLAGMGMSSIMKFGKKMVDKAVPTMEGGLEASLKSFIAKNVRFFIGRSESFLEKALSDEMIRDGIKDLWEALEDKSLKSFQQGMEPIDLSEFVVLGYEFWLKFRRTSYFKTACQTVVDAFYAEYGDEPVTVLLEDVGVNQLMIEKEFESFAPRILAQLRKNGYLEQRLRRRLERFYGSGQVATLLSEK